MGLPSSLSVHEAGHCAAIWLMGLPVNEVVLGETRGYSMFTTTLDSPSLLVALLGE
jgi:hypothetical protein